VPVEARSDFGLGRRSGAGLVQVEGGLINKGLSDQEMSGRGCALAYLKGQAPGFCTGEGDVGGQGGNDLSNPLRRHLKIAFKPNLAHF